MIGHIVSRDLMDVPGTKAIGEKELMCVTALTVHFA